MEVIGREHVVQKVRLPYIPTYLSFREGCAMASAFEKLERKPDVLIMDSCGINHPRKSGMASYFGAVMDHPTIGVSKKILCGEAEVPTEVGEYHELVYERESRSDGSLKQTREAILSSQRPAIRFQCRRVLRS